MNKLNIESFERTSEADVDVIINDTLNGIQVQVHGRLDMESPATIMGPFIQEMHKAVLDRNIENVEVDFSNLKYMNSAAVSFLSSNWIRKVRGEESYQLTFLYPKRYYLALSTMALLCHPNAIQKQLD